MLREAIAEFIFAGSLNPKHSLNQVLKLNLLTPEPLQRSGLKSQNTRFSQPPPPNKKKKIYIYIYMKQNIKATNKKPTPKP